jgi:PilZ domain
MVMKEEKRCLPRLPLDVEVNCSGRAIARSKDISEGGLCLISDEELKMDVYITLLFHIPPNDELVNAYGKVMWYKKVSEHLFETGINFWDIDETDLEKIKTYFKDDISK